MPSWLLYYVETGFGIRLFLGCLSLISFWSMIPAFLAWESKDGLFDVVPLNSFPCFCIAFGGRTDSDKPLLLSQIKG